MSQRRVDKSMWTEMPRTGTSLPGVQPLHRPAHLNQAGAGDGRKRYVYTTDHLGSIREVLLLDGTSGNPTTATLTARYDYDLWGKRSVLLCPSSSLLSGVLGLSLQSHSATSLPSPCPKTTISINRTTSSLFKGLAIQSMRLPFLGPRFLPQSLHASIGRHWSFKMAPSSTRSSARLRRICFSLPPSLASPVGSTCSSSTNRAQTH